MSRSMSDLTRGRKRRHLSMVKNTYSVKELQRETAAALRAAESGMLVTIARHERHWYTSSPPSDLAQCLRRWSCWPITSLSLRSKNCVPAN